MAEPSNSLLIGTISALAALITAAASLYTVLREPATPWAEPPPRPIAERPHDEYFPFPDFRDEERHAFDDRLEGAGRVSPAFRPSPLPSRERLYQPAEHPTLAGRRNEMHGLAREIVDRYDQDAKEIIDSMGR